jgi:hypothetical protein
MTALLSIPIASYYSIKRLALIYLFYAQQNHKLNKNGITRLTAPQLTANNLSQE